MDPNSLSAGYVAAFAVSGSVALLALQVHKRLLSNFMKQMEFEIGNNLISFLFSLFFLIILNS